MGYGIFWILAWIFRSGHDMCDVLGEHVSQYWRDGRNSGNLVNVVICSNVVYGSYNMVGYGILCSNVV